MFVICYLLFVTLSCFSSSCTLYHWCFIADWHDHCGLDHGCHFTDASCNCLFCSTFLIHHAHLTNLRAKKQQLPGLDMWSIILQVANEAAIGQVLHHQTHTEATCKQLTETLAFKLNYISSHSLKIHQDCCVIWLGGMTMWHGVCVKPK